VIGLATLTAQPAILDSERAMALFNNTTATLMRRGLAGASE